MFLSLLVKKDLQPGDAATRTIVDFLQVISPCISQDDKTTLLNPVTVDEVLMLFIS